MNKVEYKTDQIALVLQLLRWLRNLDNSEQGPYYGFDFAEVFEGNNFDSQTLHW